jgi:hypothetical protein
MRTRARVEYLIFAVILLTHINAFGDHGKTLKGGASQAAAGIRAAQDACMVVNSKNTDMMLRQTVNDLEKKSTATCFDPETDPSIQKYFYPNLISNELACDMHETKESMKRMHQMILKKSKELEMDPRLVYIRMLGEAGGDPFLVQNIKTHTCKKPSALSAPKSGFGMFQFTGGSYAAESIKDMQDNEKLAADVRLGTRETQVKYYLDVYVNKFKKAAKYTKCAKEFKQFTNLEKLAYLGIGACKETDRARKTVTLNNGYINSGATRIYNEMEKKVPICEKK